MFDVKEYYKKVGNKKVIDLEKVLSDIRFDDEKHLSKLFSKTAYVVSKALKSEKNKKHNISTTQFRKFYDKVLELNEKNNRIKEEEFNIKIKPHLSLLYSKVEYTVTRGNAGENFKKIMFKCLDKVDSKPELENMKMFLEAVIGFMPKK